MPMLPARHYESDHTRFIREMKDKKPELERSSSASAARSGGTSDPRDLDLRREQAKDKVARPSPTSTSTE